MIDIRSIRLDRPRLEGPEARSDIAQFISRDPAVTITRSAYGYVGGNPLNTTDPSGLCGLWGDDTCVGDAAGAIGGAAVSGAQWVVGAGKTVWNAAADASQGIGDFLGTSSTLTSLGAIATLPLFEIGVPEALGAASTATSAGALGFHVVANATGHGKCSDLIFDAGGIVFPGVGRALSQGALRAGAIEPVGARLYEGLFFGFRGLSLGIPGLFDQLKRLTNPRAGG